MAKSLCKLLRRRGYIADLRKQLSTKPTLGDDIHKQTTPRDQILFEFPSFILLAWHKDIQLSFDNTDLEPISEEKGDI
jgi:hypothetical protein